MHIRPLPFIRFPRVKLADRSTLIGWVALASLIIAGSTSIPFAKAVTHSLPPFSLLFVSEAIALLFTILSFGFVPLCKKALRIQKKDVMPLLAVSMISGMIAPIIVFTGLKSSGAVNAELFLRSQSFFLFLFAAIFLNEQIKRIHIFASISILLGILIVSLKGFTIGFDQNPGDLIVLSGGIIYALGGIIFKKSLTKVHPEVVLFVRGLTIVICYLTIAPFLKTSLLEHIQDFPPTSYQALIGYGGISIFLYLFGFYEALDRLPIQKVSLMLPLITVGSVLFARVYLQEDILWYHAVGGSFILLGSMMIQLASSYLKGQRLERHIRHQHRRHI